MNIWFFNLICWVWGLIYLHLIVTLLLFALCWQKTGAPVPQPGAYQTARTRACLYQVPPCPQGPQGWYRVSRRSCTHIGLCFHWGTLSWGEPTAFVVCSKWTCSWSGRETLSHLSRLFAAHGTLRNSVGAERAGPCIFGHLAGRVGAQETDGMCLTTIMPCNFHFFVARKRWSNIMCC